MATHKFSFKIITDKYRSSSIIIKLQKKDVGMVFFKSDGFKETNIVKINFRVIKKDINEDKNPNCIWRYLTLKNYFSSLEEAKEFIITNNDNIQKSLNLFVE